MGLFDNLFLDKNTPMAINTGDTRLSDIPPSVASTPVGGGSAGAGATGGSGGSPQGSSPVTGGGNPQGGSTSQGVAGMISIQNTNTVPLENTVTSPNVASSSGVSQDQGNSSVNADTIVSFDIGGDMLFADNSVGFVVSGVPESSNTSSAEIVSTEIPMEPISLKGTTESPIIVDPMLSLALDATGVNMMIETSPKTDIQAGSIVAIESPLMNLMSGFDITPANTSISILSSESPITNSPIMSTPTPPVTDTITVVPQPTETLFSLMDTANGLMPTLTPLVSEDKGEVKGEAITEVTPITPLVADTEVISEKIQTPSPLDSPMDSVESLPGEQSPAMTSVGKELARMTRSPRLQGKLIGFISGLEELSNEEELLKNEKRKQIESYMIRISELKMEYETRIHALELEMENLTEQIATMDEEREHITQVIDGFKRELEVV